GEFHPGRALSGHAARGRPHSSLSFRQGRERARGRGPSRVNDRSLSVHRFWSALFGVVLAAGVLLFAVAPLAGWWLPQDAASYGSKARGFFSLTRAIPGGTSTAPKPFRACSL